MQNGGLVPPKSMPHVSRVTSLLQLVVTTGPESSLQRALSHVTCSAVKVILQTRKPWQPNRVPITVWEI